MTRRLIMCVAMLGFAVIFAAAVTLAIMGLSKLLAWVGPWWIGGGFAVLLYAALIAAERSGRR